MQPTRDPRVAAVHELIIGLTGKPATVVVVRDGSNLILRIREIDLVAKVAGRRCIRRGVHWFEREVAVAGHLRSRAIAAVSPSAAFPPGPHVVRGQVITLWERLVIRPGLLDPGRAGSELRACHNALLDFRSLGVRSFDPLDECVQVMAKTPSGQFLNGERALLKAVTPAILEHARGFGGDSATLLGDPTPENLLVMADGAYVWSDFEDSYEGSIWWDLACLTAPAAVQGDTGFVRAVVRGYGLDADDPAFRAVLAARVLHSAVWSAYVNSPGPSPRRLARLNWLGGVHDR